MTPLRTSVFLACCVVFASVSTLAADAQPAPTPPPPAAPPPKADVRRFEEGVALYFKPDAKAAAGALFAFLSSAPQTDENYAWAQYFLARSLTALGLRHAAAYYATAVARERSNPSVVPKALEELRALTAYPHDERMIDEQVFGVLDLGFLPPETANQAHFMQGMIDLRAGDERWANTHFLKLPEGSAEASRARFSVLVAKLKRTTELPKGMIEEFFQLANDAKLSQQTRNEAMLAVARLRYELKDYESALTAYQKVVLPPLDPFRATLYLEEAWTRYKLGQLHAAMGILTTLDAPRFREEFLPDKYLLRASIYRDLCHYLPAKRAAKELTRRFADSLEAIREREDLTKDLRMRKSAAAQGATQRASRFLESLTLEGEMLGRYAGSFGDALFRQLTKLYELAIAEATRNYNALLKEAVRVEADKLLRAAEQVRLMEYEVGLKLYERVKAGARMSVTAADEIDSPTATRFAFNGEYWNDELRDYRFKLPSRCMEDTP